MKPFHQKLNIHSKNYLHVLEIIKSKNYEARLIGGVVRDAILGMKSKDIDVATTMLPEEVMKVFRSAGHKAIPTGIDFGTVTVIYNKEIFEITTLRKDINCDGRHAKVEYTNDFYLDALRRDFTINALGYCPFEEKIYDYFDGLEDLRNGIVRFIGNPHERIKEDYLRILRFFRFFGRFGKKIDQASFKACIEHKVFLKKLSRERIKSELDLILQLPNFANILLLMEEILPEILPVSKRHGEEVMCQKHHPEECRARLPRNDGCHLSNSTNNLKYALLLKDSNISETELVALKFSRQEARSICKFLAIKSAKVNEYFLKKLWLENENFAEFVTFLDIINGQTKENSELCLKLQARKKPKLPINGNDIKSKNISGREIKDTLEKLKQRWIESDFKLTKSDLIRGL
jgi:poly(A) polymerase